MAGLLIVASLAFVAGLILLIIPAFFVAFFFSYITYVMVDRRCGISESINVSIELAKKYWKATLSLLIISLAISFIQYFPIIGGLISFGLSIAYFCIYPLVYNTISNSKTLAADKKSAK
jgi:uncharacterized membrane protein